jgi:hypothetical protein
MNVTVEGKDLKVKLGTSKKEHMDGKSKQKVVIVGPRRSRVMCRC